MFYIKKKIICQKTTTLDEQHARILEEIRLGRMGIKGERCGMKVYQYGLRLGEVDMVEMNWVRVWGPTLGTSTTSLSFSVETSLRLAWECDMCKCDTTACI